MKYAYSDLWIEVPKGENKAKDLCSNLFVEKTEEGNTKGRIAKNSEDAVLFRRETSRKRCN